MINEAIKLEFINTLVEYCEKTATEAEKLWEDFGEDLVQYICECIDERVVVILKKRR